MIRTKNGINTAVAFNSDGLYKGEAISDNKFHPYITLNIL